MYIVFVLENAIHSLLEVLWWNPRKLKGESAPFLTTAVAVAAILAVKYWDDGDELLYWYCCYIFTAKCHNSCVI